MFENQGIHFKIICGLKKKIIRAFKYFRLQNSNTCRMKLMQ